MGLNIIVCCCDPYGFQILLHFHDRIMSAFDYFLKSLLETPAVKKSRRKQTDAEASQQVESEEADDDEEHKQKVLDAISGQIKTFYCTQSTIINSCRMRQTEKNMTSLQRSTQRWINLHPLRTKKNTNLTQTISIGGRIQEARIIATTMPVIPRTHLKHSCLSILHNYTR